MMRLDSRPEYRQKAAPLTVPRGTLVRTAISEMTERNYGSVVVVESDRKVVGILTERDLMRRVLYENLDPDTTPVDRVMTTPVKTARETDEVVDWLRFMSNERFRHLPVVDAEGRLPPSWRAFSFTRCSSPSFSAWFKAGSGQVGPPGR